MSHRQRIFPSLTPEQQGVVRDVERHQMVEAPAGSGKTMTLLAKVAYEQGIADVLGDTSATALPPEQIAVVTFTRKAAGELGDRLRGIYLRKAEQAGTGLEREQWVERACRMDRLRIGTIDAFAAGFLKDYGAITGCQAGLQVLDAGDAAALRAEVAEAVLLAAVSRNQAGALLLVRQFGFERARSILVGILGQADLLHDVRGRFPDGDVNWSAAGIEANLADHLLEEHAADLLRLYYTAEDAYQERLDQDRVTDYAHVILAAADLAADARVQAAFRRDVKLLLVDEHQDTSRAQAALLFRLAGIPLNGGPRTDDSGTRLVMVGDPKQGIYGWRGADITMWRASEEALGAVGGVYNPLTVNHRSRPTLQRFFDATLGPILGDDGDEDRERFEVPYRKAAAARPESEGSAVELLLAEKRGYENVAEAVAERIADILADPEAHPVLERQADGTEVCRPVRPRDIAILSRNLRSSAAAYEAALRRRGVDCYIYGGRGLFARSEIQELAGMLKVVADPHDRRALVAFLRSPLGGLDDNTLMELAEAARATSGGQSLYRALLEDGDTVSESAGRERVRRAGRLLEKLRGLRDRVSHDQLVEVALSETGYRAFLSGAADAPVGLRNVAKFKKVLRRASHEPLFQLVERLGARVDSADPEEEAPIYSPDDDLVAISTIHKAKGIEWPYVFVVGLDEGLFWKVREEEPVLDERFGVALPFDVEVEGEEGTIAPDSWKKHWERTVREEYAEAKRLFYVACTRARDRLFLAGALRKTSKPRQMETTQLAKLHLQAPEHWLRRLFPEISACGKEPQTAGRTFTYAQEEGGLIRLGLSEMRDRGTKSGAKGDAAAWPQAKPDHVRLAASLRGRAPAESIASRTGSVRHLAAIRSEYSTTELMAYQRCPRQHRIRFEGRLSTPTIEVQREEDVVGRIPASKRGDILHDYLRRHEDSWDREKVRLEMREALLRHVPMREEDADQNVGELLEHADNYLGSPLYARVVSALEVRREVPFVKQLTPDIRLRGVVDLMFREEDGWHLVDFKSGRFGRMKDKALLESAAAVRSEHYAIQASSYTLAAQDVLGEGEVQDFTFFFTAAGVAVEKAVSRQWPARERVKISEVVDAIRSRDDVATPPCTCGHCDLGTAGDDNVGELDEAA